MNEVSACGRVVVENGINVRMDGRLLSWICRPGVEVDVLARVLVEAKDHWGDTEYKCARQWCRAAINAEAAGQPASVRKGDYVKEAVTSRRLLTAMRSLSRFVSQ